jgi:hypothetical protein
MIPHPALAPTRYIPSTTSAGLAGITRPADIEPRPVPRAPEPRRAMPGAPDVPTAAVAMRSGDRRHG